ncbi:MAG: hypothetical protein A2283_15690 [Lentisphaerae bacterium RIFOXYA12_FULL_48_11]|nr:MAG: hypothetical protein A2283_15690 [Lentisphaerae bacterium RIFOXYA12_FULL_48_11]
MAPKHLYLIEIVLFLLVVRPFSFAKETAGSNPVVQAGSFAGTAGCLILEAPQSKIRSVIAPSVGARIAEYSLAGENILWDNPDLSGKPRSVGGHQCDVGPEIRNIPSHPVLVSKAYTCETANDGLARFTSATCPVLGLVCEKRIRMGQDGSMLVEHVMKNVADKEQSYCHWDRTLCKAGGFVFFRLNKKSRFPAGWGIGRRSQKQPWEYDVEKPAHPNIKVLDGVLVAQASGPEQKLGADSDGGWIAYVRGRLLFVKHFPYNPQGDYTDCGMSVALYYNDKFAEIEPMSPEISLKPQQQYIFGEKWTLTLLEREVTSHEQARVLADRIPAVPDLVLH